MGRLGLRRPLVVLVTVAAAIAGLLGAYSYWESYYQHRGFTTVAELPHAHRGRRLTVHFYSVALRRESDYYVYLPARYDPAGRRYPVYYLLHGSPGRPQVYYGIASMPARLDNLISLHRIRPMIMVFPDGRIDGSAYSDAEWANTPSGRYESYVIDVVHDVDRRFATLARRRDRVIGGFSSGAYGATNIALHHLALFGDLQAWSGYFIETRSGVFAHSDPATLAGDSPLVYVRRLRAKIRRDPFRAFLFVGRDDDSSTQLEPMARALAAVGADVSYALYPGGHDWQLWHAHLNQMLMLASRDVSEPLRAGRGVAGTLTPGVVPIPHGAGRRQQRHGRGRGRGRRAAPGHRHRLRGVHSQRLEHRHRSRGIHPRRAGHHSLAVTPAARRNGLSGPKSADHLGGLAPAAPAALRAGPPRPGSLGLEGLLGGLLLALGSAALINLGFLLQHRGLGQGTSVTTAASLREALRNRTWLAGQACGWVGFAAQIVAVAIAPLSLVQAFAAGGLALSVPLAAGLFGHRVTRGQLLAVVLIAVSLAALPIAFSTTADRLHAGALVVSVAGFGLVALVLVALRAPPAQAIAAGVLYGIADAAVKAVSIGWRAHGSSALVSGWTVVAALATFAGFLAFQAALHSDGAVSAISLMSALAALVGLFCGLVAFGESLGADPAAVLGHAIALAIVLACLPVLAAAQAGLSTPAEPSGGREGPPAPALRSG